MSVLRRMHWFFVVIPVFFGLFIVWSLATASVEPQRLGGPFVYETTPEPVKTSLAETGTPPATAASTSFATSAPYVSMRLFDNLPRDIRGIQSPLPTDTLLDRARNLIIDSGLQGEASEEIWHLVDAGDWKDIKYFDELMGSPPFVFIYSAKGDFVRRYRIGFLTGPEPAQPEALSLILDARDGYLLAFAETYVTDPIAFGVEQDRPQIEYFATQTQVWATRFANKATKTMMATLYGTPTPTATRVKPESTADIPPEKTAER